MIDFVKYEIIGLNPDELEGNPVLDFYNKVNTKTGELGKYLNAFYKGLEFKIFNATDANPNRRVTLEGSLHKYWNNGAHNFNDFGKDEVYQVVTDLKEKFNIQPGNCIFKQLEIGVNFNPPFDTKKILNGCLYHKTKRFKWIFTKDEGNYIQCQHQKYFVKIYDKRAHYQNKGFAIPTEIMRFELKFSKMHQLNGKGIYSLDDLLKFKLERFTGILLKEWANVLFYDLTTKGNQSLNKYGNPNFWENLSYEQFRYQRKKLDKIQLRNTGNLKKIIADLIKEKCNLLNSEIPEITPLHIRVKKGIQSNLTKDQNRRFCIETGLNISMQKEDSFLLSHTGLKYYFDTDRKIYDEVKRKYLSEVWESTNPQNQIKEIAHNIRNHHSNQKRKQKRLYPKHQNRLFKITNSKNML